MIIAIVSREFQINKRLFLKFCISKCFKEKFNLGKKRFAPSLSLYNENKSWEMFCFMRQKGSIIMPKRVGQNDSILWILLNRFKEVQGESE